ncbi:hypothetical protein GMORB2_7340 [Geosmithia morbida]|uniref:Sialidase n=1 Tax=Geosmithia morbida TaxID=1094350 RepID=A0A9P4YSK7_9HYPO|nr:uncharacterized protein GMORB2_7340 [Geosmithia morbida]KAF4122348.1 hypothetical protein GMORB2_7340 [Geosmithia morbida]
MPSFEFTGCAAYSTPSPPMDFSFDTSSFFDFTLPNTANADLGTVANSNYSQYMTPRPATHSHSHTRSSSRGSTYSAISTVESTPDSACTRLTTPPRASPPIHHHGALLLPKIRSQDQDINVPPPVSYRRQKQQQQHQARVATQKVRRATSAAARSSHVRSYTNPETLTNMAYAHLAFSPTPTPQDHNRRQQQQQQQQQQADSLSNSLLCSPASFAPNAVATTSSVNNDDEASIHGHIRRSNSVDTAVIDKYGYPTYRQMPLVQSEFCMAPAYLAHHNQTPFQLGGGVDMTTASMATTGITTASLTPEPEAMPSTTLAAFLTSPNPAASLVRTISFPHRDPTIKHFWWDVRNVRSWSSFNAAAIMALPGASDLLTTPVPAPVLAQPAMPARHPETEAALHAIYASYYLPKLNSALALTSGRPLQLSAPSAHSRGHPGDLVFTANPAGESSTASAIFGGKPTARVVGLVRTFDRFNTGMRAESNIKRVEYLRGLAALHHAMREHGCRYGFILTEIELVLVRNGTEATPFFGDLEITSVQLATASEVSYSDANDMDPEGLPLTACLALWGLCQLANASGDHRQHQQAQPGHAHWRSEIGAPAEGTRRKAHPRDSWMPAPQLAEKREAKRSRGWVFPEDAVGRKELGKRGVRYNGV